MFTLFSSSRSATLSASFYVLTQIAACGAPVSDQTGVLPGASDPSSQQGNVGAQNGNNPNVTVNPNSGLSAGGGAAGSGYSTDDAGDVASGSSFATTTGNREDGPKVDAPASGYYSVPMSGCVNGEYFAYATFGGTQAFSLLVDSGSTTTAVASASCTNCGAVDRYDPSNALRTGSVIAQSYGDGSSWRAEVVADTMRLGNVQAPLTPAPAVRFGAITSQGNDFFEGIGPCSHTEGADFDGIIGLGPDGALTPGTTSFLTRLNQSGSMAHNAFALTTCDVGGTLSVGGYDSPMVRETPIWVPLIRNRISQGWSFDAYYTLNLVGVALGEKTLTLSQAQLGPVLIDNGTNYSQFSPGLYQAVRRGLAGDANFQANFRHLYQDTSRFAENSALNLTRQQLDDALPPLVLSFQSADGSAAVLRMAATRSYLVPLTVAGSTTVYYAETLYQGEEEGQTPVSRIIGNSLLRQHTVVFDRDNARLGFAGNAGCSATLPSFDD